MMDELVVRAFEAKDAPEMALLHKEFSHHFEEPELTIDYINQCSIRHDFRFFIAEHNKKVVGYCGVLFYESVGRAEIGPIAILTEYQNKGVGKKLLEKTTEFLKQKAVHRIMAKVKESNLSGISFFMQNGFKKEAFMERYTKKGENAMQLVKFIR